MTENNEDAKLPPPVQCDACGYPGIVFTTNAALFGANCLAPHDAIYHCPKCRANVGVYKGTRIPLGFMADAKTRALRARAHNEFDPIWRWGRISRNKAYELLAVALGIERAVCHFGMMDKTQLIAVMHFAREYTSKENQIKQRRDAKKNVKRLKRQERDALLARRKRLDKRHYGGRRHYGDD